MDKVEIDHVTPPAQVKQQDTIRRIQRRRVGFVLITSHRALTLLDPEVLKKYPDAKVVAVMQDTERQCLRLLIESADFPEVEEGTLIPYVAFL